MIIISPAKKLNLISENFKFQVSEPIFFNNTLKLVEKLKKLSKKDIKNLMNISVDLAELNYNRFQNFSNTQDSENSKPAAFTFSGDTFVGLDINSFSISEIEYAQKKLRILSGLYGLLKPLDIIQPYRLEMGINVQKILDNSLYDFWEQEITKSLNSELEINKSNFLLNLSSNEYFKCINSKDINVDIISVKFLINKDGDLRQIGMLSKKCRGAMARFVLKNKITNYKDIKDFNDYGYSFYKKDKNTITFVKD